MIPERRPNLFLLGVLIVILLVFIIFVPTVGWRFRGFFTSSVVSGASGSGDNPGLAAENDSLKAQVDELQKVAATLPTVPQHYIRAMVYSRYPFGFKNELIVNAGANNGVAVGAAVTYQGLFVGRVSQVWKTYSAVQTVFDDSFRLPVRIGSTGADGLLTGGSYPYVASIAKNAHVAANDAVYNAAAGSPYGLSIGEVVSTSTSPDTLFMQAALSFPYDINSIQTVLIASGS